MELANKINKAIGKTPGHIVAYEINISPTMLSKLRNGLIPTQKRILDAITKLIGEPCEKYL